jgi:hypothetical protein
MGGEFVSDLEEKSESKFSVNKFRIIIRSKVTSVISY